MPLHFYQIPMTAETARVFIRVMLWLWLVPSVPSPLHLLLKLLLQSPPWLSTPPKEIRTTGACDAKTQHAQLHLHDRHPLWCKSRHCCFTAKQILEKFILYVYSLFNLNRRIGDKFVLLLLSFSGLLVLTDHCQQSKQGGWDGRPGRPLGFQLVGTWASVLKLVSLKFSSKRRPLN